MREAIKAPSPGLVRVALAELIRMGPETRRSADKRLADRAPKDNSQLRAAALAEAERAVKAAESLAREYVDGARTQDAAESELRRQFAWLADPALGDDLTKRLGNYGHFLAIK
jgi:hypothetical protein